MKRKLSKQDRWMRSKLLQGLCMTCGKDPVIIKKNGLKGRRCRTCSDRINAKIKAREIKDKELGIGGTEN